MKKLPKKLYVYVENEGDGDNEFLSTHHDLTSIVVETGKRQRIGEYVLKQQYEIETTTNIIAEVG